MALNKRMAPGDLLSRELERMIDRAPPPRPQPARTYRPAMEVAKVETGIRLNSNGSVTIHGTTYTRAEFRAELEVRKRAALSDPHSAYYNARDPNHQQVVEEVTLANKFLSGELSAQDEHEIVGEWNEALQETSEMSDIEAVNQELAEIVGSPEGRIALQRARTGQPLDAKQAAIVARNAELEALTARQADTEKKVFSSAPSRNRYIGKDVMTFAANKNVTQRRQLAAEHIAKVGGDKSHPYWDAQSTEHKAAVLGMRIAHEMVESGDSLVQIGPDGSIVEE